MLIAITPIKPKVPRSFLKKKDMVRYPFKALYPVNETMWVLLCIRSTQFDYKRPTMLAYLHPSSVYKTL